MAQPRVPSKAELSSLPRWAIVAFAARCAERVEPLFKRAWPQAPNSHVLAVRRAVQYAKEAAARAFADIDEAKQIALAADMASHEADWGDEAVAESNAYFAAHSAANAVGAIAYIDEASGLAYYAAYDASLALSSISKETDSVIYKDFELLKKLTQDQNWTSDTRIPQQLFSLYSEFDDNVLIEHEAARLEAYYAWERAGRPSLSKDEQERMYFEALERVRQYTQSLRLLIQSRLE